MQKLEVLQYAILKLKKTCRLQNLPSACRGWCEVWLGSNACCGTVFLL